MARILAQARSVYPLADRGAGCHQSNGLRAFLCAVACGGLPPQRLEEDMEAGVDRLVSIFSMVRFFAFLLWLFVSEYGLCQVTHRHTQA